MGGRTREQRRSNGRAFDLRVQGVTAIRLAAGRAAAPLTVRFPCSALPLLRLDSQASWRYTSICRSSRREPTSSKPMCSSVRRTAASPGTAWRGAVGLLHRAALPCAVPVTGRRKCDPPAHISYVFVRIRDRCAQCCTTTVRTAGRWCSSTGTTGPASRKCKTQSKRTTFLCQSTRRDEQERMTWEEGRKEESGIN